MRNLNIGTRLGVSFGVILLFLAGIVGFAIYLMWHNHVLVDSMEKDVAIERLAKDWHANTRANSIRTASRIMNNDPAYDAQLKKEMGETSKTITEIQEKLAQLDPSPEAKGLMESVSQKRSAYMTIRDSVFKAKAAGETDAVKELMASKFSPALQDYESSIKNVSEYYKKQLETISFAVDDELATGRNVFLALAFLAALLGAAFSRWIAKSISVPLQQALEIAESIAAGNLNVAIRADSTDETGRLLVSLGHMRDSLEKIVQGIRGGTQAIVTGSQQIASGNSELSGRTEEQASSLEQTAASMEQITATVRNNADNAQRANYQAQTASDITQKGGKTVNQVVATMHSINESSRKIVEIIGVIDGIAFQTNILALNAAVEAARAGEQGKGFAVVATEVRSLAQRSAEAAKEIKVLIDASVSRVGEGLKQVSEAGEEMQSIMLSIGQVREMVETISVATKEQSSGTEEVNIAISQIDKATQQNAALVEEAAAAATSLQDQAERLSSLVSVFVLSNGNQLRRA